VPGIYRYKLDLVSRGLEILLQQLAQLNRRTALKSLQFQCIQYYRYFVEAERIPETRQVEFPSSAPSH
jgi:hypothetical protein